MADKKNQNEEIILNEDGTIAETEVVEEYVPEKRSKKSILIGIIAVVLILALGAGLIYGMVWQKNYEADWSRHKIVKSSNYTATLAMMQYFFQTTVESVEEQYDDPKEVNFDVTKDLKTQDCPLVEEGNTTWYDYILDLAKNQMNEIISLCEAAKADGIEMTDGDKRSVKLSMNEVKYYAECEDQTIDEYVKSYYGEHVSADDVEECLTMTAYANRYYLNYAKQQKFSEKEIKNYYNNNKGNYVNAVYYSYVVKGSDAKKIAKKLTAINDKSKFEKALKKRIKNELKANDPSLTDANLTTQSDNLYNAAKLSAAYSNVTKADKWAFNDKRKAGDTFFYNDTDNGGYRVLYMVTPFKKDLSITKNVRYIYIEADEEDEDLEAAGKKANTLLKEWRNGKKNEASFALLASKNSCETTTVADGGFNESITKEYFSDDEDAVNNWIFSDARKPGDVEVIEGAEGYYLFYFVGNSYESWEANVVADLRSDRYYNYLETVKNKYGVKIKDKELSKITQIVREEENDDEIEFDAGDFEFE